MRISILIPTFRRPESFLRAARSALAQRGIGAFEVIGVDNTPEGSALALFRVLEAEAGERFRWRHEPAPGVANARDAALQLARGDYVAWLDDDQEAPPHWLTALFAQRQHTGAQSVFGPVTACAPAGARHAGFFEQLYTRCGPAVSGLTPYAYGIGNSLQPRALFADESFDPRANETGGEDDRLFAAWAEAGATFAWAADAGVIEHLAPERLTLAHGVKRAFAYGQGPCETAWAQRRYAALARHMSVGAAQAITFGIGAAACAPAAPEQALACLDRAARGAGKVFWFNPQRFYGEALARQTAA